MSIVNDEALEQLIRRVIREELQTYATEDRLLTADQVAEMLGYKDVHSVYRLKKEKKIEAVYISEGAMRFWKSEVKRFIQAQAA